MQSAFAQNVLPPIHEENGVFSINSPLRRMDINQTTPLKENDLFKPRGSGKDAWQKTAKSKRPEKSAADMVGAYTFDSTGFISAILAEKIVGVKEFLDRGMSADTRNSLGQNALSAAVNTENLKIIKLLLLAGADPNVPSKRQSPPPLMDAIASNNMDIVKLLLQHKAKLNIKDGNGWTPLHHTIHNNNVLMMLTFIKMGASINVADNFNNTPLMTAIQKNNPEMVFILLQNGANLNVRDFTGASPLLAAVAGRRYKIVKILLEAGANAKEISPNGIPMINIALDRGYTDIANLLLAHGAIPPATGFGH